MQNRVFVLDKNKKPLAPCHPARARQLLRKGRAAVYRHYPFTIILKDREGGDTQPTTVKIDPGAKTTGIAIVADHKRGRRVIWAAELEHRGWQIRDALLRRRQLRRGRRTRKLRYRQPRFLNRRKPEGWLPPSLVSRVENTMTWVERIRRYCPVTGLSMELNKFDTQQMQNPEISGIEYQRGELFGYEVWAYLLEKWRHKCAYCGRDDVPLQKEHIVPKARGGSNRVSNLCPSCAECNLKKGKLTAAEFGHSEVQAKAKQPLRAVAVVNATRWALYHRLDNLGLPLEVGTGGRTKFNREKQSYPKMHWTDAACVGPSGRLVFLVEGHQYLNIKATGHGKRQRCITDKYGFPKAHAKRAKKFMGYQTGDIVEASIPKGKYAGCHVGKIAIRHRPSFRMNGFDVHPKYLRILHCADGYEYANSSPR